MADVREQRMAGALLGVHAGDALGAHLEFSSWAQVRARYPDGLREIVGGGPFDWRPGQPTDDTDLTRAVLHAYLSSVDNDVDVVRAAADNMVAWLTGDWPGRPAGEPPRDIGGATARGLQRYRQTGDPRQAGAGPDQAGNGSLMRCIPTALAVAEPAARIRDSMEISAITHDDARCTVACAAYNEMAAALIDGADADTAVLAGLATAQALGAESVADAIQYGRMLQPAMLARTGETHLETDGGGFVLDSLSLAVAAVLDIRALEEVLVDIVRLGNDTDSNAAIAGGLLGARDGIAGIPPRWLSRLEFADEFLAAAHELAGRGRDGVAVRAYESVSTWRQPEPTPPSAVRAALIAEVAARIVALSPGRPRVAIDGFTASGKTSFGHELATAIRRLGRSTLRASLDDFKNPWREAGELGYDRLSGEGYYRNAYDHRSTRELLLDPMGPDGSGQVVLCAHDPLTGEDHRDTTVAAPADAVLIVDSVFAFRPEYNDRWDFRIWLDVDPEESLRRGVVRDVDREGLAEATRLHRDRYHAAELIYLAEVDPRLLADVVIDNRDFAHPVARWAS